ncbi:MAG TPA: sigma-54 dependent transcriptional regulator [Polyangiales bacterium]|nr:sigma-54 dependent transcriptional regulator [Polyangiales bacterium]
MSASILICDDEKNIRRTLGMVLEGLGHRVFEASSAEEALALLDKEEIELAILDVRLPKLSGIEALQRIRAKPELVGLPVIMISGHASLAEAVHSVQLGATDFLEKPLDRDRVLVSVANALKSERLQREVNRLRAEVEDRYKMVGQSAVMADLFQQIEKVAPTKGRVLITGESGTGKELIARAIHSLSDRKNAPFVMLNCAAIPSELIESELFGHERGAFTGAHMRKKGMFELADGGSLFLDEIGDMSLSAQAKVLRALQSGEISRVGGERAIAVDARVIAATNKDLAAEVERGNFRDDLYFRLNVIPLHSPALRERVEDIPLLAKSFLNEFGSEYGGRARPADPAVFALLQSRPWPGNVRELRNVIERMVILAGPEIRPDDVPMPSPGLAKSVPPPPAAPPPVQVMEARQPAASIGIALPSGEPLSLRDFRDRAESEYIRMTLKACDWNISRAATQLGVERTNLHKKMRALRIARD